MLTFVNEILSRTEVEEPIIEQQKVEFVCSCGEMRFEASKKFIGNRFACNKCGEYIPIAVSEESTTESKDYSTGAHCQIWLNRLQGKEHVVIPEDQKILLVAKARRHCYVAGSFQINLVDSIKCGELRDWLRELKMTHFNKNIASIRRIITRELGREVIPPQFSMEEERMILLEWNRVAEVYQHNYRELKQSMKQKTNKPYYPVCILFIVERLFPGDLRVTQVAEYVHRQALDTMMLRRLCWEKTIEDLLAV